MYKYLKLTLMTLAIITNTLLYLLFSCPHIYKNFYILLNKIVGGLTNAKIRVHGNTNNFSNNNLLIMSNHSHVFLDGIFIYNLYYENNSIETLHTIVQTDFFTDRRHKIKILHILSFIQHTLLSCWYLIPYKRCDKEDGKKTRNKIVDCLNNGKNILIFPEGTTHKDGIPKEFKKGTFELAVENKLRILPITIKYAKDIGKEKGDPIELLNILLNIFDNVVDIYIHDLIDENDECYTHKNPEGLKDKVFDIIRAPMLV
jgi:1-acyl-sn-glycerol-3-phosphate acyltransferase